MKTIIAVLLLTCVCAFSEDIELAAALAETGAAHAAKGKTDQAKETLYRALVYDIRCPVALFELAKMSEKEGDNKTALALYQRSLSGLKEPRRSVAEAKVKTIPVASRMIALLDEYARGLERVMQTRPEQVVGDEIENRIISLKLSESLSPQRMPRFDVFNKIDLLRLLESSPGNPVSDWERTEAGIISPAIGKTVIQIPYAPPESYCFSVEFKRLTESGVIGILVPTKSGIHQLWYHSQDRMDMPGRPEIRPPLLGVNTKCVLSMKVTGTHIDAFMNDKLMCSTDKPAQADEWILNNKSALGFGIQNCKAEFTSIKVVEFSGHGSPVK